MSPLDNNKLWQRIIEATEHRSRNPYLVAEIASSRESRDHFVSRFSWAIPSYKAIEAIKEFVDGRRILEVGAGLGLWARLLSDAGVDIIATDLKRNPRHADFANYTTYTDVEKRGAVSAVRRYRDCQTLMVIWPPYDHSMAYYVLREFRGDQVVYIGEGDGGCTANDAFHRLLDRQWLEVETVAIPQWPAIHDDLTLYRRR